MGPQLFLYHKVAPLWHYPKGIASRMVKSMLSAMHSAVSQSSGIQESIKCSQSTAFVMLSDAFMMLSDAQAAQAAQGPMDNPKGDAAGCHTGTKEG